MTNTEALTNAYEALAPFSDTQRWEFDNNLVHVDLLTRHLPKEGLILDAGCYIGILALALRFLGYNVVGADKYLFEPSAQNAYAVGERTRLEAVWQKHGLRVLQKDLMADPFEQQYDAIISVAVIEHQKYPRLFIEKLIAHTAPGGIIYVATPNVTNLLNRFRVLLGRAPLSNIKEFYMHAETFNGHWREYTLREVVEMCTLSGLRVIAEKNCQSMKPRWSHLRKVPHTILRVLARLIPGTGDTNVVIGLKK